MQNAANTRDWHAVCNNGQLRKSDNNSQTSDLCLPVTEQPDIITPFAGGELAEGEADQPPRLAPL